MARIRAALAKTWRSPPKESDAQAREERTRRKVTSRKQAIAIGLSEARKNGGCAVRPSIAGRYVHAGAEQLERASRLLRENNLEELYRITNKLAHDRPLAFIGGSVAAGFLLARILRSTGAAGTSDVGRQVS